MGADEGIRNIEAVVRSVGKVEPVRPYATEGASIDMSALTTPLGEGVARSVVIPSARGVFERVVMGRGSGSARGV